MGLLRKPVHDSKSLERNLLMTHKLFFSISSKGSFIYIFPQRGKHINHSCRSPVEMRNSLNEFAEMDFQ